MTRESLKKRLDRLDKKTPPRRSTANDEGGRLLRAVLVAEFGINARDLFGNDCPVLLWLHRCREGDATAEELALLSRIAAVRYFDPPVETHDYLIATAKIYRDDF